MSQARRSKPSPLGLEAAAVGHQITHEDDLAEAQELATLAVDHGIRSLQGRHRDEPWVGALLGAVFAKVKDALDGQDKEREAEECPDPCGVIEQGSENTFVGAERQAAALAGHEAVPCEDHEDDPIRQGSAHVWVNGKPWARRTDETECGAFIGEGEPTVMLGPETSDAADRKPAELIEQALADLLQQLLRKSDLGKSDPAFAAKLGAALSQQLGSTLDLDELEKKIGPKLGDLLADGKAKKLIEFFD